jgi:23S rRNA (cytidine1920-2'-O)/16S rRNA (cytidine1409-2'-O)-methyltransferase
VVSRSRRARFVALRSLLVGLEVEARMDAIAHGRVLVDGRVIDNPAALVRSDAVVRVVAERRLRGDIKLSHALDRFDVPVSGRVAVDLGASAGGFTTALLGRGARRVYAVDVGIGQLVGRLRNDERVVNLEGCNLGSVDADTIPEVVEVITLDLGYLPLVEAFPQTENLHVHPGADLVALVKPTFELKRGKLADSDRDIVEAVERATGAVQELGWRHVASCPAPRLGRGRAREVFIHARHNWSEDDHGPGS